MKTITKFFAATFLLLSLAISAFAYDFSAVSNGKTLYYNITSSSSPYQVEVTGSYSSLSGSLTIPSSVTYSGRTYSVTSIGGSAFFNCSGVTSVTIPNSVTSIGEWAFYYCSGLTTVNFNATNCTTMGSSSYLVFQNCNANATINIGEGVTTIPDYAFRGLLGSGALTIPNSVTSIGSSAFDGCSGLTSVTIPNSVTSIGGGAFFSCSGLTSVSIPNSVTSIGDRAFCYCSGLTSPVYNANCFAYFPCGYATTYTIPNGIQQIAGGAFYGCSGLTSVTIPNSVTSIGEWAFYYCSGLTSVTIPNSVTSIGGGAFSGCSGLTSITIPSSVTSIGEWAFSYCNGLTSVTIPNSVTSIGGGAFSGCSGLTTINFNATNCTSMGGYNDVYEYRYAFENCTSLSTLNIGENVTNIPANAFSGCSGLTTVNFNAINCTTMGGYDEYWGDYRFAFENCTSLSTLNIGENVTNIPANAFSGCNGLTGALTIPNSVTSIGDRAFYNCSGLTSVTYNAANCAFGNNNGITGNTSIRTLTIGESVTNYPVSAFRGLSGLTSVYYNRSLADWCGITFGGTDYNPVYYAHNLYINGELLTNLVIPESVAEVKPYSFCGASCITSLSIPDYVTNIGNYAFYNCSGLTSLTYNAANCAFGNNNGITGNTSIRTLTIGESVTNYPVSAFRGLSGLTSVYYNRSLADWCGITFEGTDYNPVYYAHNLYINGELLTNLVIPESVAEVKPYSFCGASCITSLSIPDYVTSIGSFAFSSCNGLTELTLGESLTSIADYAFSGCSALTTLNYNPINCTSFGSNNGISGNTSLTTLTIGENVMSIPNSAFTNCSGLAGTIVIPNSVTNIGDESFLNCSGLTSLSLGESVATIGNSAFSGCTALSGALVIPNSVTNIGGSAFNGCSGISSLTVGESVASIGESAFENCSQIRTMTLGSNVATIGDNAFANCTGLFMATVKPEFPPMAQSGTFTNVSSTAVIKVPCGSVAYYNAAQYWNYFTNVQGDYVYSLTVGCNNNTMGYATVVSAPTCNNPSGVISATAYDRYRFDSWNDGNTENPRTVTLTSDANYIANFASLYPTVYNSFEAEACGSYTWNEQTYTTSGEYQQTFTAVSSADSIVTLNLTIYTMPQPEITASGVLDGCNPSPITLSAGDYSAYNWSTGANTATISISESGYYYVEVIDAHGCTGISEQINIGLSNALTEAPQISVVGMNSENHNVVAWSALDSENVNAYRIYRENNVANVYEPMATVEALQTTWTDSTADPTARAYRYKVTAVDECGGESPMSDYHKTMHLTINQGLGNTWNLIWSHYEGFNFGTYRIYRGTSPSNMTMIGEVPSNLNSYTDNTATDNTGFYYQVEVVRNNRSRDAEISSRSNIVDNGIFPEYTITVMSANPNRGTVTGGGTYPEGTVITIEAIANEGFEFVSWNDENTDNPRQITVTADATYIASFDPATGIEETSALEIALFPNPANDILNITSSETISEIEIVNTLGQVVKRIEVNADDAVCDVEELKAGVYVVRIHAASATLSQRKFVKE